MPDWLARQPHKSREWRPRKCTLGCGTDRLHTGGRDWGAVARVVTMRRLQVRESAASPARACRKIPAMIQIAAMIPRIYAIIIALIFVRQAGLGLPTSSTSDARPLQSKER